MGHDGRTPTLYIDNGSDAESHDSISETHAEVVVHADEAEEVYAGLAAEELRTERLFAGDTIEYYSMAFVFGDPRGYRVAKVLKVAQHEREYPLRLDSQEMLPNTLMIKRQLTRRGEELEPGAAVWRKIRTYRLVDGEVAGKTRADRLNEGLQTAVIDAFQSLRPEASKIDKPRERTTTTGTSKKEKTPLSITSFFTPKVAAKGSLEAVVTARPLPKSVASSKSEGIEKRPDGFSKSQSKRSRVELTPSPSTLRATERDRKSLKHKHTQDKRDRHLYSRRDRSSDRHSTDRLVKKAPSEKIKLVKFVENIVEQRFDPRIDLNSYLRLDRQERAAMDDFDISRKANQQQSDQDTRARDPSSHRLRAGNGDRDKVEPPRVRMKSLYNFFEAPKRPHPDAKAKANARAHKTSSDSTKLNFFMDTANNHATTHKSHARARDVNPPQSPKKKRLLPQVDRGGKLIHKKR